MKLRLFSTVTTATLTLHPGLHEVEDNTARELLKELPNIVHETDDEFDDIAPDRHSNPLVGHHKQGAEAKS